MINIDPNDNFFPGQELILQTIFKGITNEFQFFPGPELYSVCTDHESIENYATLQINFSNK